MKSDLLNLLRAGGVRVRGAAEPAQDPREILCDKLKAKLDLDLDPKKITRMSSSGIEYKGDVHWQRKSLTKIPVKFLVVRGTFNCSHNNLTTLENSPEYVAKDFNCRKNHLTSLEHSPEHVGASYICSSNQLTTLRGAADYVGKDFVCANNKLTSLAYAPARVDGNFICENNLLSDIDPQHLKRVGGNLVCDGNSLPKDMKKPLGVKGKLRYTTDRQTDDFEQYEDFTESLEDFKLPAALGAAEPAQDPLTQTLLYQLANKLENARSTTISLVDVLDDGGLRVELYVRYGQNSEDDRMVVSFDVKGTSIVVAFGSLILTKPYPKNASVQQQLQFLGKLVLDTVDAVQEYIGKGYTEACTALEKQYFEAKSKLLSLYKVKTDGKLPGFEVIFTEPN